MNRREAAEIDESHDTFARLFECAPVGYLTFDSSERIIHANIAVASLLGMEREDLAGQALSFFVTPPYELRLHRHLSEIMVSGESRCELALKSADKGLVQVRLDSIAIEEGIRLMTITDLTKGSDVARSRNLGDKRLHSLSLALPVPIAYADRDGVYQFNNNAHEQWFNISCEAIAGRLVREILGDEIYTVVESCIERVLTGESCVCPLNLPGAKSRLRSVELHYAPHRDENDEVVGFYEFIFDKSAGHNISEERPREEELETRLLKLTGRQRAIVDLLMTGASNRTMANELDISQRTVERERHNILERLNLRTINEVLVAFGALAGSTGASIMERCND